MRFFILASILLVTASCKLEIPETDKTQFSSVPTATIVETGQINKVSGLADSRSQPGNLWAIQESGTPAQLTMVGYDGKIKGKLSIPNFTNRDWQDLAIGPGPNQGTNYIYIADTGDNSLRNSIYQIYRLPEPTTALTPITQIERINFRYPDGARDAKAVFVDPLTKDIYIIANRNPNVNLYRLAYPQNINEIATAEAFGELVIGPSVTGATISPDGREILVRTYTQVIYWKRGVSQTVADVLKNTNSRPAPLQAEAKGEAICFNKEGSGYFTLSQTSAGVPVNLYYYAKQ